VQRVEGEGGPSWWRLTLSGGTPFSRAEVILLRYYWGGPSFEVSDDEVHEVLELDWTTDRRQGWESVLDRYAPSVRFVHGQTVHLPAEPPLPPSRVVVGVRWQTADQEQSQVSRLHPEPW